MGADLSISRQELGKERILVELGLDNVKGREMGCTIMGMRKRRINEEEKGGEGDIEEDDGWKIWKGKTFKYIYTDGSWKREKSMSSNMLDSGTVKVGGAIIIADDNWFSPIAVDMDVEVGSAHEVEGIMALGACVIAEKVADNIKVHTDCLGAIAVVARRS